MSVREIKEKTSLKDVTPFEEGIRVFECIQDCYIKFGRTLILLLSLLKHQVSFKEMYMDAKLTKSIPVMISLMDQFT